VLFAVPLASRAVAIVPLVMSLAACVWLVAAAPMSAAVSASLPPVACDVLWALGANVEGMPDSAE
jgi:MFS-type transporter involved in bile tolerance (Atg22 family)